MNLVLMALLHRRYAEPSQHSPSAAKTTQASRWTRVVRIVYRIVSAPRLLRPVRPVPELRPLPRPPREERAAARDGRGAVAAADDGHDAVAREGVHLLRVSWRSGRIGKERVRGIFVRTGYAREGENFWRDATKRATPRARLGRELVVEVAVTKLTEVAVAPGVQRTAEGKRSEDGGQGGLLACGRPK